jgi:hypothetical protein
VPDRSLGSFRASEKGIATKGTGGQIWGEGFLSPYNAVCLAWLNAVCLAWLAGALQRLRPDGQTKAVGYLEEVLEEVVFEMEGDPCVVTRRSEGV